MLRLQSDMNMHGTAVLRSTIDACLIIVRDHRRMLCLFVRSDCGLRGTQRESALPMADGYSGTSLLLAINPTGL